MIFINPQWQGSGETDKLKKSAELYADYFKSDYIIIPLSEKELTAAYDIRCFEPILEQAKSFRNIIGGLNPLKISTVGGDCGIEIIPISYLNQISNENLCIIWIDAHPDLNTPESSPSNTFHGMPLRTLLNEGNSQIKDTLFSFIRPEQVCFVGLRDIDEDELNYINKHNITMVAGPDYIEIRNAVREKGYRKAYIHLDLDVLDRSEFKFTLFPTDNGLMINEVIDLIKKLKIDFDVVGICITESTASSLAELDPISEILDEVILQG